LTPFNGVAQSFFQPKWILADARTDILPRNGIPELSGYVVAL
jgi:hypothetical protein